TSLRPDAHLTSADDRRTSADNAKTFENGLRAIEDGEKETPRDRWDPDYVVASLGSDPQVIVEWVRENTGWIPYHGVLRGPVGVLMDRQGSSLDRALLLATLLERAGQRVRLAHGLLSTIQAIDLLPNADLLRRRTIDQTDAPNGIPEK